MDEEEFWKLIELSLEQSGGAKDKQEAALLKTLLELEPDRILSFRLRTENLMQKSFTWDLWGVAYIINGGCSDDGFEYFRNGLIASGREKFEKALVDPETISDWAEEYSVDFEGFCYVSGTAFTQKTGKKFYDALKAAKGPMEKKGDFGPSGEPWEEEAEALKERFPKTWAKFGQQRC